MPLTHSKAPSRFQDFPAPVHTESLKNEYPKIKIAQWFLDPLNKKGPDFERNKRRILDKSEFIDANFITTSPDKLNFLPKNIKNYFIPNPVDSSFETLNNFKKSCSGKSRYKN